MRNKQKREREYKGEEQRCQGSETERRYRKISLRDTEKKKSEIINACGMNTKLRGTRKDKDRKRRDARY